VPERSSGTGPRRAHGAAPKAQAPLLSPPTSLPCLDVGNVSTSALLDSAAAKPASRNSRAPVDHHALGADGEDIAS
jgi:hypothetical protein